MSSALVSSNDRYQSDPNDPSDETQLKRFEGKLFGNCFMAFLTKLHECK
jgi:hypothetical protein